MAASNSPRNKKHRRSLRTVACAAFGFTLVATQLPAQQQTTFDAAAPAGSNYAIAEFRLWLPESVQRVRAVAVLMPGSNGDGRGAVMDSAWQSFARRNNVALLGGRVTDKPHEQSFIEHYINVSQGSGDALINVLSQLGEKSNHPELAQAPLLMWGMSAGGQFNYEFVAWKPERVAAFVVNKGGIYYSALLSQAARSVPGILFVGGRDLEFRTNTIVGLFAVNRRGGALWALADEPSAGHIVGRSADVARVFFEDVLPLRLPDGSTAVVAPIMLKPIPERSGFLGDLKARTFQKQGETNAPNYPTAWLPTERVARAWEAMVNERGGPAPSSPPR